MRVKKPSSIIKVGNAYNILRCCYLEKSSEIYAFSMLKYTDYKLYTCRLVVCLLKLQLRVIPDSSEVTTQTVLVWRQK